MAVVQTAEKLLNSPSCLHPSNSIKKFGYVTRNVMILPSEIRMILTLLAFHKIVKTWLCAWACGPKCAIFFLISNHIYLFAIFLLFYVFMLYTARSLLRWEAIEIK